MLLFFVIMDPVTYWLFYRRIIGFCHNDDDVRFIADHFSDRDNSTTQQIPTTQETSRLAYRCL